ncbi:MAG: hemagglutinin repeat-containing protein [Rickettsiales bacterium]|jgi:hypothetical protein|nr:hemagglutinin repeat-containing protein [Rickettsiales bacterium]
MTDNLDFETIPQNLLWEQLINQLHDCYEGNIELSDLKKLNEQGQYSLDISTSCLNNVINIKNNVGAKELLLKFDSKISWINAKIHSNDNNLNLFFQAKEELYIGDLDSSNSLYTKLFGNKITLVGKVLSKTLILQTKYFECTKDALLSTTSFTEILIGEKGAIDCKIISDGKGILIKRDLDNNIFKNITIGKEGLISSTAGLVKFDLGYNSKLDIAARKLGEHEEKQSIAIASGKDIKIISGKININEGRAIIIYDDEDISKTGKVVSKSKIIIDTHNLEIIGGIENKKGKIGIYFDASEENFTLLDGARIKGWEIYIDHNKGKGSIEGEIKAGKNVHVIFGELTLGEKNGKKSTILSQGEGLIEVVNKWGEFNHYGVIGSQSKLSIKSLANYYNDGGSLLIAEEYLGLEVYQGRSQFINGMIYVRGKGYFGVQPHKDINFMPGSVIWLGNYEMSVNDYKVIKLKSGAERLSTGTIRCYGCKFSRFGSGEERSEMDMLVFEITGTDVGTNLGKLGLTDGNEKGLAKLEAAIAKNTVITAEWHDAGLTKIKAGLIKEGTNAILNFQGPTVLEIPTDIIYYLEGGGEKPQFYINAYGKLGSLIDGNDPFNMEKKFIAEGENHLIKQSTLGFERKLMLSGSGIYDIDLIDVRHELKDGWIWKKQDISCKENCEFLIEGRNGVNFKPMVYFTAKENKEIREYIKFPFDVCAFLENLGFKEIGDHLIIGDGQYLYKLVNDVAYKKLGLFIGGQEILLNILASNALWEFTKNPLLEVGKELSSEQKDKISKPIIWPIWKNNCIEGQRCMNFKLYGKEEELVHLDKNKANIVMLDSEVEVSGNIAINDNTKLILRDSKLIIGDYLFNKGLIETIGKVYIEAKNIYQLGKVSGKGEICLAAREEFLMQLLIETVEEYYLKHYSIKSYAKTNPNIEHEGDVYIGAGGNVKIQGGNIKGKKISIEAGDKVIVIPAEFYELYKTSWSSGDDYGWESKERWINKLVEIVGKEGVRIVSKNDNILYAPQIKTEGDLEIGSVMGSNKIISVIDRYSAISYEYEDGGFWSSDKTYYNSYYQEKAQEARLDTKGIKFLSAKDTVIQGGYIAANWVTMEVGDGKEGSIILLPSREVSIKISEVHKDGIFRETHHIKRDSLSISKPTIIYVKEECIKEIDGIKCSGGYFLGYAKNQYLQLASDVKANEIKIKAPQGIRLEASIDIEERYEYKEKKSFGISFTANSHEVSASIGARISKYEATTQEGVAHISTLEGKIIILETEETLNTQGARITAEKELITKSKLEIHDVVYDTKTHSQRKIEGFLGLKLGIQNSIAALIESGKSIDKGLRQGGEEGAINTAFAAWDAYNTLMGLAAGGGLFQGGVWISASYQESSSELDSRIVRFTKIEVGNGKEGVYESTSEELRLKSTQIQAYDAYFNTNKLTVETASNEMHSRSQGGGINIQVGMSGTIGSSVSGNTGKLSNDEIVPINAQIHVTNRLVLKVNGHADIRGASITATSLEASFESLILESVKELEESSGKSFGLSTGWGKKVSHSLGGSFELSNGKRNVVGKLTELIGYKDATVIVAHALELNGAMIANAQIGDDGKYTDLGNLVLTVGELFVKHVYDSDEGYTLGASIDYITGNKGSDGKISKYGVVFGGRDGDGYTFATIGKGEVRCTESGIGKVCEMEKANRDVSKTSSFDYDYKIETIRAKFSVLDEETKKKAIENLKSGKFFENIATSFMSAIGEVEKVINDLLPKEKVKEIDEEFKKKEVNKEQEDKKSSKEIKSKKNTVKKSDNIQDGGKQENRQDDPSQGDNGKLNEEKASTDNKKLDPVQAMDKRIDSLDIGADEKAEAKYLLRKSLEEINMMPEAEQNKLAEEIKSQNKFSILDIFIPKAEAVVPAAIGACLINPWCAALLLGGATVISSKLQDTIKSKPSYQVGINLFEKDDIGKQKTAYLKQGSAAATGAPDPDDFDPDDYKKDFRDKLKNIEKEFENKGWVKKDGVFHHPDAKNMRDIAPMSIRK